MQTIDIDEILKVAVQKHGAGEIAQAEKLYRQILETVPNHPGALYFLAMIASGRGEYDIAIELVSKAIKEVPNVAKFYNTLGGAFKETGKLQDAVEAYKQGISLDRDNLAAYNNLSGILQSQGRQDEAIENYKHVVRLNPSVAEVYYNLGVFLKKQGSIDEAIENYKQAIRLKRDFSDAYYNLANILRANGRQEEAIENYKEVIRLKPDFLKAYNILGEILNEQKRYSETVELFKRAIKLNPDNSDAYNNLGVTLMKQGHYDEAIENYNQSLKLNPENIEAHRNTGMLFLLTNKYKEGWEEYEWRRKSDNEISQPYWDGSCFKGKRLLVRCEQGMGDSFQFVRYLPMVKERGGTVIFGERKSILTVLGQTPGIDEFVELEPGGRPNIEFDHHVRLLSLPGIFETRPETIPAEVPYIYAPPAKTEFWQKRLCCPEFKVGIVWAGGGALGGNAYGLQKEYDRSCCVQDFAPLAGIDGVRLYGLQKGKRAAEIANLPEDIVLTNFGEQFEDFTDTAAVIENLDLIISIDTSVAHLAGAMGKRVWTMLPFAPDWRWMLDRADCPWYPSMKLFRQKKAGDWHGVFESVQQQLKTLAK
ncbi:tetratricopeptide repeat protein [Planctomycetota bacterium]